MTVAELELLQRDPTSLTGDELRQVAKLRLQRRGQGQSLVPSPAEVAGARLAARPDEPPDPELTLVPDGDPSIEELDEQRVCWRLYLAFGCTAYWLSQPRESKQSPGISDLWLFHRRCKAFAWHEVKRQVGGALSPAQRAFRELAIETGCPHIAGDRSAAARWLLSIGAATREQLLDAGEGITPAMLD